MASPESKSALSTAPGLTREQDAPRKEVIFYAVGNIESGLANQFYAIISIVTVVALGMSPMLVGLIISAKTIFDAVTDPLMAQVTDNARTRWGRRIPFILLGGVARVLLLLAILAFFPRDASVKSNAAYQQEKEATAARKVAEGTAAGAASTPSVTQSALPSPKPPPPGLLTKIQSGFKALTDVESSYHKTVFYYLLAACLLFAAFSTVVSVPYYALGIELAPSYDGRTRVVTFRAYAEKGMQLVGPWILPFCFLPMFDTVLDGLLWYGVFACVIGIPTTVAMCMKIKERGYGAASARKKAPPLFTSIWQTARNPHFLKVLFLYVFIGFTNAVFAQIFTFLVLYWVFAGDMLTGTIVEGYARTLGIVLAFASLPLVQWTCQRLGKHVALRIFLVWMAVGASMKWFLLDPHHPYLQLLLPFFFSVGISSVHVILPTLMADVTDMDELEHGVRREGMFGAVMAFLSKAITSLQPVMGAAVLVACGFDASLGVAQAPEVIFNMRLMASWIPAGLLLFALFALWRYPLTREFMAKTKDELVRRRAALAPSGVQ